MGKTKTTAHKQSNPPVLSEAFVGPASSRSSSVGTFRSPTTYLRFAKNAYFAALNRNT